MFPTLLFKLLLHALQQRVTVEAVGDKKTMKLIWGTQSLELQKQNHLGCSFERGSENSLMNRQMLSRTPCSNLFSYFSSTYSHLSGACTGAQVWWRQTPVASLKHLIAWQVLRHTGTSCPSDPLNTSLEGGGKELQRQFFLIPGCTKKSIYNILWCKNEEGFKLLSIAYYFHVTVFRVPRGHQ